MKQLFQDLSNGKTFFVTAPKPICGPGHLCCETSLSLISAGTERMLVDFSKGNLLQKARSQPDKVKLVFDKIRTDGLLPTVNAVKAQLENPIPLGYCNVGVVAEVGEDVKGYRVGDRVVSNGPHADLVSVPKHLCALVPDTVDDESAAFAIVASIGLQGIRLANPTLGESCVVIGAGLIGLLTIQLLRAQGCRVLAIDFNPQKLELAQSFGAEVCNLSQGEDPIDASVVFSRGRGVDATIITASTASSDPVSQAAQMSRKRGRIVLVGVTGLNLSRSDFYEKELSFQVSCSYGPGRYDPDYEESGHDYPLGFVRWTEQRNFEAVLDMMASGQLDVSPLVSHRFDFEDASRAYETLAEDNNALGIILRYSSPVTNRHISNVALAPQPSFSSGKPVVGFIGAGNYASRILIPAFRNRGAQLHTIATAGGTSAVIHGQKARFGKATTDVNALLASTEINSVAIVTRHNSHAELVIRALNEKKHVFVEKPLAITMSELDNIQTAYKAANATGQATHLMVGFNRRFAPQVVKMKTLLDTVNEPKSFIMVMNAGAIPADHWTQDIAIGGGRIIGEACHYIDLMRHLVGAPIVSVQAICMGTGGAPPIAEDKATITLGFADGSFGTINYLANGAASFAKERIEVFTAGRTLQLDNFRKLHGFNWPGFKKMHLWRQDKGQSACAAAFLAAIEDGTTTPIPAEQLFEATRITIEAASLLRQ